MSRTLPGLFRALVLPMMALLLPLVSQAQPGGEDWRARVERETDIDRLGHLYVEYLAAANPVTANFLGIHGHPGAPFALDRKMPDVSLAAWADFYSDHRFLRERLAGIDTSSLSAADSVDLHILRKQVDSVLLDITRLGDVTNPLTYVGQLGSAFTSLVLRDYAPLADRLRSFGARCAATPEFLEHSRAALLPPYVQPTAVQKQVAQGRLHGMTEAQGLFGKSLPQLLAGSKLADRERRAIEKECATAVSAIDAFSAWFTQEIVPRPDGEWRLGPELFRAKYDLVMDYPLDPDALLAEAQTGLKRTHSQLVRLAREIHDRYLAETIASGKTAPAAELGDADVVRQVMDRMSEDRSTADSLIADSYALADAIVGFVREHDLLDLPPTSKLRIEDIPPHLSGFAVAQILTAPPFEPELESVWFWDLALLATSEDYLREYNRPALALVYIHEGVPGHFVQLEYSNRFPRIAPRVFANTPMVEGWATYIATQLVEQGFTIYPDHPFGHELQRIADLKLVLRSQINAIIDIRLHTQSWPEEEALQLMTDMGFQESGEAQGKLTRAKLSSVQLSSYFAGHHAILGLLGEYQAMKGADFRWKEFNERLVSAGSPPFFALRDQMLGPVETR